MVIQINAEADDTVQSAAQAAVNISTNLGVNVLFFWDRLPYEVKPGSNAAILVQVILDNIASAVKKAASKKG